MKAIISTIVLLSLFYYSTGQNIYIPAQIVIPALQAHNGTHYRPVYNWTQPQYNNSHNWNTNQTSNGRNYSYGWYQPPYNGPNFKNQSNNTNSTADGHLLVGVIGIYDRLLYNQVFYKPSRWWSSREKIIEYPKDLPDGYTRHETITALRIYNKFVDGNTARASIESGGIGRQYIKIKLKSDFRKGFKFLVQIYGH